MKDHKLLVLLAVLIGGYFAYRYYQSSLNAAYVNGANAFGAGILV